MSTAPTSRPRPRSGSEPCPGLAARSLFPSGPCLSYDRAMAIGDRAKAFLKKVGPGFVTGVADDDPSGVATYSIAGAQFGYRMSWLSLFLVPSMVAVQEMCGRLGKAAQVRVA